MGVRYCNFTLHSLWRIKAVNGLEDKILSNNCISLYSPSVMLKWPIKTQKKGEQKRNKRKFWYMNRIVILSVLSLCSILG